MLAAASRERSPLNYEIRPSTINNENRGNSKKNVAGLYAIAADYAPTIVFINEADALWVWRKADPSATTRNMPS